MKKSEVTMKSKDAEIGAARPEHRRPRRRSDASSSSDDGESTPAKESAHSASENGHCIGDHGEKGEGKHSHICHEHDRAPAPCVTPKDVVDFDADSEEIYVVGTTAGHAKVTKIAGLERCSRLQELTLRSCLISKMEGLEALTSLTKLELYDNQILSMACMESLGRLVVLDLSYNLIKSLAPLRHCPLLEEVYVAQNRIRVIEGLDGATRLRKLDLGANRIRRIEGLANCMVLEELWLGKNKIDVIANLDTLGQLRRLDVQSNRLTRISGLERLSALEELYLAGNAILTAAADCGSGGAACAAAAAAGSAPLAAQAALSTLDLSRNRLTDFDGLLHLTELEDLWMTSNGIDTFEKVEQLQVLSRLETLYLEHNPIYKDFEYRMRTARILPSLKQLDATEVRR